MVLVLIDGGVILPKGDTKVDAVGIMITMGNAKHTIPYNQIKWIYENSDPKAEQEMAQKLTMKPPEPIKPIKEKTDEELVTGLYK